MTVTITSSTRISANGWKLAWSSDQTSPVFYVWQDGVLAMATRQTSALFSAPPDGDLIVDVFDDPQSHPAPFFSGRITLSWYAVSGAAFYHIQENLASTWTLRFIQPENGGWYYTWRSRYLEDCQTHNFRIIPKSADGNQGDPIEVLSLIVRYPDVPRAAFSYDPSTHKITLA